MRWFVAFVLVLFTSVCFAGDFTYQNTSVTYPANWDGFMSGLYQGADNFQSIDISANYGLSAVQVWPVGYEGSQNAPATAKIGFDLGTPPVALPTGANDFWSISLSDSSGNPTATAGIQVIADGAHPMWELTSGTWSLVTTANSTDPFTNSGVQNYAVGNYPNTSYFAVDSATVSSVPEPSTLALLLVGIVGCFVYTRRG
jgi:hypothetical protein